MKKIKLLTVAIILAFTSCLTQSQNLIDEVKETFNGVKELEVNGSFCYVEIIGGDGAAVDFHGEIKGLAKDSKIKIMHKQDGDKLKVWLEKPNNIHGKITGKLVFKTSKTLTVDVDNSSGKVFVSNITNEKLDVNASSGSVEVENIAAKVDLSCSSGSIKASNISGNTDIHTSSGSQRLSNVTGNIDANASSGRITIENTKGNINVGTSSGSIHLTNISGQIKASASSGSIDGDEIMLAGDNSFKTSSGSVKIDFKNKIEEIGFDISASSGSLHVGENKYKKNYKSSGEITLKGNTSSGSQRYF